MSVTGQIVTTLLHQAQGVGDKILCRFGNAFYTLLSFSKCRLLIESTKPMCHYIFVLYAMPP